MLAQGVLLLVYPLLGHLADVYLTRYRALTSSLIILTIVTLATPVYLGIDTVASIVGNITIFHQAPTSVLAAIIIIMYITRTV